MQKINKPIIGVLGGMGPQASVEFYRMLIEKSIAQYGARDNHDFPEIVIDSVPVPDFISSTKNMRKAKEVLIDRVQRLNAYGVSLICIACNTAHILLSELQEYSQVPFVSMNEEVKERIAEQGLQRVGLLSSSITAKLGLYNGTNTKKTKLITLKSTEQQRLEYIIREVIAGSDHKTLSRELTLLVEFFINESNLDGLLLGCTELSAIFPKAIEIPVINSLDVLSGSVLHTYFSKGGD